MKELKSYEVPVEWVNRGTIRVQAYSPRHAFNIVFENECCLGIPDNEVPGEIRVRENLEEITRSEAPAESNKIGIMDEWMLIAPEDIIEVREDE